MSEFSCVLSNISVPGIRCALQCDGMEIAHAYLYIINNDSHERSAGYVEDVFVVASMRKRGVGTQLMRIILDEAKKRGCYKLVGTSRYDRPEVHAWYAKLGFKDYGKEFRIDL